MSPVIRLETPARSEPGPVVFDSPHSGTDYPADFAFALDKTILQRFKDPLVDELYGSAPDRGAPLLSALFPRTYIDVNRNLAELDVDMVEGAWPYPTETSRKVERGVGLIWRRCRKFGPIYDRLLPVTEVENRIETYWRPYHAALAGLIDTAHAAHGLSYHVNCHSMTSHGDDFTPDGPGRRPDFVLGDHDGRSCEPGFTALVAETLGELGYSVTKNFPYRGAELTSAYADPEADRHSLQIEVNQGLYLDEDFELLPDGFVNLKENLDRLIDAIAAYAQDRIVAGRD